MGGAGAVTFLLTEVAGSVASWERDEGVMVDATGRLDRLVTTLVEAHRGTLVKPRGEGDSHFLVFDDPVDALTCAGALVVAVADEPVLPVRAALHVGPAEFRDGDWYGTTVNRCARLRAAANPRQILVSADVAAASEARLSGGLGLRSLGRHRLKDLDAPTEVFQLLGPGLVDDHPPPASLVRQHGLRLPPTPLVGRADDLARVLDAVDRVERVTITGAPGVGKSRLALEAAAAWFSTHDGEVVVWPVTATGARVGDDDLVVVDDADRFTGPWPAGRWLATSREPTGREDTVVRLAPLDDLDATRLLVELAGEAPGPTPEVTCGLPLAIGLLARRLGSMDPDALVDRLERDPLAVLGGDRRAEPARHTSVRAALDWGWDALESDARDDLIDASPGDARWVDAGWHEPDGPLPLIVSYLAQRAGEAR